jgi:hypothetical protein
MNRARMTSGSDSDVDDDVRALGPSAPPSAPPQRVLAHARTYLAALPCAQRYRTPFMHRSSSGQEAMFKLRGATHEAQTGRRQQQAEGHWNLLSSFVPTQDLYRRWRCHRTAPFWSRFLRQAPQRKCLLSTCLIWSVSCVSSSCRDFVVWVPDPNSGLLLFAVAHKDAPVVSIFAKDALQETPVMLQLLRVAPVTHMAFNAAFHAVVFTDERGLIEYWAPSPLSAALSGCVNGDKNGDETSGLVATIPGVCSTSRATQTCLSLRNSKLSRSALTLARKARSLCVWPRTVSCVCFILRPESSAVPTMRPWTL